MDRSDRRFESLPDWRQALEQLARMGEEVRSAGSAGFEALCSRAGVVSRESFEVQAALLRQALERVSALEQRIAALEGRAPSPPPAP